MVLGWLVAGLDLSSFYTKPGSHQAASKSWKDLLNTSAVTKWRNWKALGCAPVAPAFLRKTPGITGSRARASWDPGHGTRTHFPVLLNMNRLRADSLGGLSTAPQHLGMGLLLHTLVWVCCYPYQGNKPVTRRLVMKT